MRVLRYSVALAVVLGLVAATAWYMSWSFGRAVTLAPVIVIAGATLVGLALLWGKVALGQLRETRHPRRVVAYWLLGLALLVVLTLLGVKLPSETG